MSGVSLEIKGLSALQGRLKALAAAQPKLAAQVLEEEATTIARDAKVLAPVDTGNLRASIEARKVNDLAYTVGVHADAPAASYAPSVEYGSKPHKIRAKNKKRLAFKGASGDTVFPAEVNHPGTKAQPFLGPALLTAERRLPRRLAAAEQRALRGGA